MNSFYINRLKTFSFPEIPYRIKQMLTRQLEEKFYQKKNNFSFQFPLTQKILSPIANNSNHHNTETVNVFGKELKIQDIGNNWHFDIFSGKSFPLSFSKKLEIRSDENLSAKNVWEINRLQFLLQIALKFNASQDDFYLKQFIEIIQSWKSNNPFLTGINWYSNIEVNLRLINWFLCWEALDADNLLKRNEYFKQFVLKDWLPLIYQHCIYSYQNPSKYSSANNHLISEYAGLFIAASKWKFKESDKWIKYSAKGLEEEIIKQHSKNGINKEEAAEYIQFITDFFLLAYIVGEKTNNPFSKRYKEQLYLIFDYIYNFLDCKGNFPKYGDEDDGRCFIIDPDHHFNNFRALLTAASIIFKNSKFKGKSNGFDAKNEFLFGAAGRETFFSIPCDSIEETSKFYPDEGHFIFRKKRDEKEVYLHFDAAPLGFLSIAAHGHADALSFILHVNGQPFLIDSGTYTYHTERSWRNYFIGTLAHNTIRINKQNQALIGGPTLWLKHYKTNIIKSEINDENEVVIAEHNGYKKTGVTHRREIYFDKQQFSFRITDTIECKNNNACLIEIPFHVHPSVEIKQEHDNQFVLSDKNGNKVCLLADSKLQIQVMNGQIEPEIIGWYSESFMQKQATSTILGSLSISGNVILETTISIN